MYSANYILPFLWVFYILLAHFSTGLFIRLKFLDFMITFILILEINELNSAAFKWSCTHQVDSGMELRNGLLAFLLSFFNPAEGLLVGPWAQLGGQWSQSNIVTWLLNRIESFHFFGFFFWSYKEGGKKKRSLRDHSSKCSKWQGLNS